MTHTNSSSLAPGKRNPPGKNCHAITNNSLITGPRCALYVRIPIKPYSKGSDEGWSDTIGIDLLPLTLTRDG